MKIAVLLLYVVGAALAAVYEMPLARIESLREKPMREDKWNQYYMSKFASRATHTSKISGGQSISDWTNTYYVAQRFINMTKYNKDASSTYVSNGQHYEDILARGILGQDKLCLVNSNLCFTKQVFGMVTYYLQLPGEGYHHYDGILGLGWPAISIDHVVPPIQNLLPNLDQPLFTVWLANVGAQGNVRNGGQITYGAIDTTHCSSTINYMPLTAETYWQFRMTGISVGSYSLTQNWQAMTTLGDWSIGGPTHVITAITNAIGGRRDPDYPGRSVVPCNGTYPPFILTIGGLQYSISHNQYVMPLPRSTTKCYLAFFDAGDVNSGFGPAWLLGDPFIRSYCNIYHVGGKKIIGFAQAKM